MTAAAKTAGELATPRIPSSHKRKAREDEDPLEKSACPTGSFKIPKKANCQKPVATATANTAIAKVSDRWTSEEPRGSRVQAKYSGRSRYDLDQDYQWGRISAEQYQRERDQREEDFKVFGGHYDAPAGGGSFISQLFPNARKENPEAERTDQTGQHSGINL